MGEVRVKVRLTNYVEERLAERGLLNGGKVHTCEVDALVDTGSARAILPRKVVEALHLEFNGEAVATCADCRTSVVPLAEIVRFDVLDRSTVQEVLVFGDEVILGQVVLETMDLRVDCRNQQVIPNPAHPNGPTFRV